MLSLTGQTGIDVHAEVAGVPIIITMRMMSDIEAQADALEAVMAPHHDVLHAAMALSQAPPEQHEELRRRAQEAMERAPRWKEQTLASMRRQAQRLEDLVERISHAETGEGVELPTAADYERHPFGLEFIGHVFRGYAEEVARIRGKSSRQSTPTPTTRPKSVVSAGDGRKSAAKRGGAG
jgi:hypothetical protein